MRNVLIVEDDPITLKILYAVLEKYGFAAIKAENGNDALMKLQKCTLNAIILDLNLPDINGLEVLKQIRSHPIYSAIAIIIVTENSDKQDAIVGLEMGADDYITKPFNQRELIARLNSVLRRTNLIALSLSSSLVFNDLFIDFKKRLVKRQDKIVNLTFKEFEILSLLASNPGEVLSRDAIMNAIGGFEYSPETRTVDMHIASIRKKIKDIGKVKKYIDTVSGVGYRFRK